MKMRTSGWHKRDGNIGWRAKQSDEIQGESPFEETKQVNGKAALRQNPSSSAPEVAQLEEGANVVVKRTQEEGSEVWCYVEATTADGKTHSGWILQNELK